MPIALTYRILYKKKVDTFAGCILFFGVMIVIAFLSPIFIVKRTPKPKYVRKNY